MEKDELKSELSHKFESFRPQPPQGLFEKTMVQLPQTKRNKGLFWLIFPLAIASVFAVSFSIYFVFQKPQKSEQHAKIVPSTSFSNSGLVLKDTIKFGEAEEQAPKGILPESIQAKSVPTAKAIQKTQMDSREKNPTSDKPVIKLPLEETGTILQQKSNRNAVPLQAKITENVSVSMPETLGKTEELNPQPIHDSLAEVVFVLPSTNPQISVFDSVEISNQSFRKWPINLCSELLFGAHTYLYNGIQSPNAQSQVQFDGIHETGMVLYGYGLQARYRMPISKKLKFSGGLQLERLVVSRIKATHVPNPKEGNLNTTVDLKTKEALEASLYYDFSFDYVQLPFDLVYSKSGKKAGYEISTGLAYILLIGNKHYKGSSASPNPTVTLDGASGNRLQQHRFGVQLGGRFFYALSQSWWMYAGLQTQWQWRNALHPDYVTLPNPMNFSVELGIKKRFSCNR
ncbi:hypothetical protein MASR2M44_26750 [Bacteroidota bacterium]